MANKIITPTDRKSYSQGFTGSALKGILIRGEVEPGKPIQTDNILARAANITYNSPYSFTQADEINTTYVKETNMSRQELITLTAASVWTLRVNDQMPTWDTLRSMLEMTFFEVTGDDHPLTDEEGPVILNVITGLRIVNTGSATVVNQQKILNINMIGRQGYTGAAWKLIDQSAKYPAEVVAG